MMTNGTDRWHWANDAETVVVRVAHTDGTTVIRELRVGERRKHFWSYPEQRDREMFDQMILDWCLTGPVGDAPGAWKVSSYNPDALDGSPIHYRHRQKRGKKIVEVISPLDG